MARSLRTARSAWLRPRTFRAARTDGPGWDASGIESFTGQRLGPRSGTGSADRLIPSAGECRSVPGIKGPFGNLTRWSGDQMTRCLRASKRSTAHQSAGQRTRTAKHEMG